MLRPTGPISDRGTTVAACATTPSLPYIHLSADNFGIALLCSGWLAGLLGTHTRVAPVRGLHASLRLVRGLSSASASVPRGERQLPPWHRWLMARVLTHGVGALRGWKCIERCGACCYLDPSRRPHVSSWLSVAETELYRSMVGADGWCVHFDQATRRCTQYESRPQFCSVQKSVRRWRALGLASSQLAPAARTACEGWIEEVYGAGDELLAYRQCEGESEPPAPASCHNSAGSYGRRAGSRKDI